MILPNGARVDLSDSSGTSGGKFAIRIFFVPISAMSMHTIEISPLLCLYSACPHVSRSNACTHSLPTNFIYTCRSGRRSGLCSPSFLLSVICYVSIHVFRKLKSLDLRGQRRTLSYFGVRSCFHVYCSLLVVLTRTGYYILHSLTLAAFH